MKQSYEFFDAIREIGLIVGYAHGGSILHIWQDSVKNTLCGKRLNRRNGLVNLTDNCCANCVRKANAIMGRRNNAN